MTRIILAALATAALAAPAVADSGFAIRHLSQGDRGDGAHRLQIETPTVSRDLADYAVSHFAADESGDGERLLRNGPVDYGPGNVAAARIRLDNDERGFN